MRTLRYLLWVGVCLVAAPCVLRGEEHMCTLGMDFAGVPYAYQEDPGGYIAVYHVEHNVDTWRSLAIWRNCIHTDGTITLSVSGGGGVRIWTADRMSQVCSTGGSVTWPAAAIGGPGQPATVLLVEGTSPSAQPRDVHLHVQWSITYSWDDVYLTVIEVDADVDAEDYIENDENKPGKVILVNNGDTDMDGIPNFADGFDRDEYTSKDDAPSGEQFVPILIKISQAVNLDNAKLTISYNQSTPGSVSLPGPGGPSYAPGTGALRLWTKNGSATRTMRSVTEMTQQEMEHPENAPGFYVPPGDYTGENLAKLGFTGSNREVTLFMEGIAPGRWVIGADLVVTIPEYSGSCDSHDAVAVTCVQLDLDIYKTDGTTILRPELRFDTGAFVVYNNDDDNGNGGGTGMDKDDNEVQNEDDLVKVTFRCSYDLASLGVGTVMVSRTNSKIRLWKTPSKGGPGYELEFSYNGMDKMYNLAEMDGQNAFRDEILNKTYWIEGAEPSQNPKDTGLRLIYEGAGQAVEITVVTFDLDVNNDGDIGEGDGTLGYMPGYEGQDPLIAYQGIEYVYSQAMQLIAKPLNWAEITSVHYSIVSSSQEPGFCMNSGSLPAGNESDYSFASGGNSPETDAETVGAMAKAPFFCKDFGAWGAVRVTIKRGDEVLFEATRKVPSDGNNNWIADAWIIGDAGGAKEDTDTQPVENNATGDGLTRYEEYRGFLVSGTHVRTDPTKKDVFVCNKDVTDAGVSGFFTTPSLGAPVHVVNTDEYSGSITRWINFQSSPDRHDKMQSVIVVEAYDPAPGPYVWGETTFPVQAPHYPVNVVYCRVFVNNIKSVATQVYGPGGINETQTNIPVITTDGFHHQGNTDPWTCGTIRIDDEVIKYTGLTAMQFTGCTRGYGLTLPASHSEFAHVSKISDPDTFIKRVFAHEAGHCCNLGDGTIGNCDVMSEVTRSGATLGEQFSHYFGAASMETFRVAPP